MKRTIHRLILSSVLVIGVVPTAWAEKTTFLTVNAASYHLDRSREYNERNSGVGIEHHFAEDLALVGGFYRNSSPTRDAVSTYGGIAYTPFRYGPVRIGMMLGAVTGYKAAPVLPTFTSVISIGGRQDGVNIQVLPSLRNKSPFGAVGLQLKRKF